jgi:hypothetical protein
MSVTLCTHESWLNELSIDMFPEDGRLRAMASANMA